MDQGDPGLLAADCILLHSRPATRQQVLSTAADVLRERHGLRHAVLLQRLLRREQRASTGLGWGVALPHSDMPGLRRPVAAFLRARDPVPFDAPDRVPVRDFLVLVVPRPAGFAHFDLLQHYRRLLVNETFRDALRQCEDASSIWRLFRKCEWGPATTFRWTTVARDSSETP